MGNAGQRKKVDRRKCHHDGFSCQMMNGKRRGVTFRNPNPSYRTPAPFYQMIGLLNLTSFKKTLATIATDKLNIHQLPVSVIERDDQITGAEHHPTDFMS